MLGIGEAIDSETGLIYKVIGQSGSHTAHSYFTVMSWRADSRHIIAAVNVDPATMIGTMVEIDTVNGYVKVLQEAMLCFNGLVTADDVFYYSIGAELLALDMRTGDPRLIAKHPNGCAFLEPLSITNDGKRFGVYWAEAGKYAVGTVDASTGEVKTVIQPDFPEPHPIANHAMINPVYANQLFYAHEGSTEQIVDRIWSIDVDTGAACNLYKQRKLSNGENGEYVGHEMWSYDGEWLYFVKYPHSPIAPTGIYRVSRDGGLTELMNEDYRYWHVCPSPDGRYAVADTLLDEGKGCEIVLIDLTARKSRMLCRVNRWNRHPGHPHPSFSPDSRKIIFTFADDHNLLRIGIIEL
ncbi:hypothetical protein PAT3040_00781 [Paenibacillus agaridevorans]|uniref:Oligogalacturonate lyase domain-containing protein n=1 Tax=Paenibacillus agaridevorans TaxID=171404 RepID=A0A2R5ESA0_9BACL|nr:PD40 domain-containing protein [Paenibacillus agaridevorans]GBG06264.1 hypothetical protein PAT3040_00781 [Paenibacillus agaridevorans]